jgi:hypothetical protein
MYDGRLPTAPTEYPHLTFVSGRSVTGGLDVVTVPGAQAAAIAAAPVAAA